MIVIARADHEGLQQSTPAERATIAELWINRDWNLYAKWMATPHKDWAADGLKASDHDFARNAVVNATRDRRQPDGAAVAQGLRCGTRRHPIRS